MVRATWKRLGALLQGEALRAASVKALCFDYGNEGGNLRGIPAYQLPRNKLRVSRLANWWNALLPEYIHGRAQTRIVFFFELLREQLSVFASIETRTKLREGLYLIPDVSVFWPTPPVSVPDAPPLVAIEVLSPERSRRHRSRKTPGIPRLGRWPCLARRSPLTPSLHLRYRSDRSYFILRSRTELNPRTRTDLRLTYADRSGIPNIPQNFCGSVVGRISRFKKIWLVCPSRSSPHNYRLSSLRRHQPHLMQAA